MGTYSNVDKHGTTSGATASELVWKLSSEVFRVYIWVLEHSNYILRLVQ